MELIVRRGHPRVMAASYGPRVWLALATIYVVWGSTFMAVTIAVRDVPALLALGVRQLNGRTASPSIAPPPDGRPPRDRRDASPRHRPPARRSAKRSHRLGADPGRLHLRRRSLPARAWRPCVGPADRPFRSGGPPDREHPALDGAARPRVLRQAPASKRDAGARRRLRRPRL